MFTAVFLDPIRDAYHVHSAVVLPPPIASVPAALQLPTVPSYQAPSQAPEVHPSPLPPVLVSRMTRFMTTNGPMEDLSLRRLICTSRSRVEMILKLR